MVKLTAELIDNSRQCLNAVNDRELNLRGYKIPMLENLGATYDQFDTIDFTDNDLKKLENFPLLHRLKSLLLSNNRISYIDGKLGEMLPHLNTLILTNNNIQELGDLDVLSGFTKLEHLSLIGNPVTHKNHYRLYMIYKIPQLRVLDFQRIRMKEKDEANALFKGKKGAALRKELVKTSKTFAIGELPEAAVANGRRMPNGTTAAPPVAKSAEEVRAIQAAIAQAKTLEEVAQLQQQLQAGHVPGQHANQQDGAATADGQEEEMEEN